MASLPPRDPITCHVLDQTTGLPAASLSVTLTVGVSGPAPATFTARTSTADGRINAWTPAPQAPALADTLRRLVAAGQGGGGRIVCALWFDTKGYFGEEGTFFPEVEIRFFVGGGAGAQHWHVPLLLGPWSYTTYRGS